MTQPPPYAASGAAEPEDEDERTVEVTAVLPVRDDGPKGYYGPPVELLMYDDGTVGWRYDR